MRAHWVRVGLLYGSLVPLVTTGIMIRENVVFRKINEISPTRSRWSVTIIEEFDSYDEIIYQLYVQLNRTQVFTSALGKYYFLKRDKNNFSKMIESIKTEVDNVGAVYRRIHSLLENVKYLTGDNHRRRKRSLLPFVGSALSFLFGTVSEGCLNEIRNQVGTLSRDQQRISHVVQKSLTIIQQNRGLITENRQSINHLITDLSLLRARLDNVTELIDRRVSELEHFYTMYFQVDLALEEIKLIVMELRSSLNHFFVKLKILALGRLSPSVIAPRDLKELLLDIRGKLPPTVKLPNNPDIDLWIFYKYLECTTIVEDDHLLVIVHIPLLDGYSTFDVYQTFNLPVPIVTSSSVAASDKPLAPNSNNQNLVARYTLENEMLAINSDRTQYVLFTPHELDKCTNVVKDFCTIKSPPVHRSKACIVALFMEKENAIKLYSEKVVHVRNLPLAQYISDGQ